MAAQKSLYTSLVTEPMAMSEGRLRAIIARAESFESERSAGTPVRTGSGDYSAIANGLAIIEVIGVLTPRESIWDDYFGLCPCNAIAQSIDSALLDPDVKGIVLDIDSPGGFVGGTAELADAIAAANEIKPVFAIVRGLCCSGAYWLASQCRRIFSRPESEVGNIGVYSVLADETGAYEQMGIKLTLVASAQFKGLGADGKVTDEFIADTTRIVAGLFAQFVRAVAAGREISEKAAFDIADGRAWLGPEALSLGLIDEISTSFDEALDDAAAIAAKPTPPANSPSGGNAQSIDAARAAAKRDWKSNRGNCHETWIDEETFVAARLHDFRG